jgi:TonB family protein
MNTEHWKTWEGRVVDAKFPLRQWLGGSDHSAVFLTERSGPSSPKAAIKLIPARADSEPQLARWRAAAKLSHPHLLPIFAVGTCQIDGTSLLYLVIEYAEEDLSQILPQRPLTAAEVADMLPPIVDAVAYLHAQGYVHSSIKPSNIMAAADQLKLSADRICRIGESIPKEQTRDEFEAPETAIAGVSREADVWSIGATLVAALTQRPPIEGSEPHDPVVPDAIPEPFRGIARACLRRDPSQRCTLADIKSRLQPGKTVAPTPPPRPIMPVPPAERKPSNWRVLIPIVTALVIGALLIVKFVHHEGTTPKIEEAPPASTSPAPTAQPTAEVSAKTAGEVVRRVLPDVPPSAARTIQGTIKVTVRVDVDSSGKVTLAKLTSPGHSPYFARLALNAAQGWEFSPPQVNGQPASSVWNLRFQFKKSGNSVSSARVH